MNNDGLHQSVCLLALALIFASFRLHAGIVPAPDFTLPRLDGHGSVSLLAYRGSYVLVDFWASWCEPCRESLPVYNQIRDSMRQKFGAHSFEVLAINVDISAEEGRHFVARIHPDYVVLREDTGATQRAYQLDDIPESFLVDPQGNIVFAYDGFGPKHAAFLRARLETLLTANAPKVYLHVQTKH